MNTNMTPELFYLTLASVLTACQWMPYIINQVTVRGLVRAMGNPHPDDKPLSIWADRARRAHSNSIENLIPFGLLVLVAHLIDANNDTTALAALIFFVARCIHYFVFILGVPYARTLMFVTSWLATMTFAVAVFKVV